MFVWDAMVFAGLHWRVMHAFFLSHGSGLCLEITHDIKTLTVTQRHAETQTFILTEKDSSALTLDRGVTQCSPSM